jgi:hypothetical protein
MIGGDHGLPTVFDKGLLLLLWAGLQSTHVKITISGILIFLNYCVICVVYTEFTDVASGCM